MAKKVEKAMVSEMKPETKMPAKSKAGNHQVSGVILWCLVIVLVIGVLVVAYRYLYPPKSGSTASTTSGYSY